MAQYVIDSVHVNPNGMEEVIGSIPIRSTKSNQQLSEAAEKSALCFPLGWRKRLGVEIRRSGIRM
jgi:hypothetical protein